MYKLTVWFESDRFLILMWMGQIFLFYCCFFGIHCDFCCLGSCNPSREAPANCNRTETLLICFCMSRLKFIWFVPSLIAANSLCSNSKKKKSDQILFESLIQRVWLEEFGRREKEDGGRVFSEILPYNCLSLLAFVVFPCETLLSRPRRTSWRNLQIVSASGLLKSCPCPDRSGLVSGIKR